MNSPNPFKRNYTSRDESIFVHGRESKSSVLALFSAALGNGGDAEVATCTLDQLSDELTVLAAYFEGEATLSDEIVNNVLRAMSERARVAAEVQRRIDAANRGGSRRSQESDGAT
ncbi:MAG: hypothetical protein QM756_10510 [Polyangiaceae bacterium]